MIPTVAVSTPLPDVPGVRLYQQAISLVHHMWNTYSVRRENSQTIAQLQSMDEYLLCDIGLERADIVAAVKGRI